MKQYKQIISGASWTDREEFECKVNKFLREMPNNDQRLIDIDFETGFYEGEVREYVCHIIYEE